MLTTGINAIDVVLDDMTKVSEEYIKVFGFEDCGADESGHMTKVGDFHIYFRLGTPVGGGSIIPVLATESVEALYQVFTQKGMTLGPLQKFSETFKMFEVTDSSGIRWSYAGA